MNTNTLTIEVSTKKGEVQKLRFLIVQNIPFPCVSMDGSMVQWTHHEGLFTHCGRPAQGIGQRYTCYLLADTAPETVSEDCDRTIFAGYKSYRTYTQPEIVNGGTLKIRGKDLGEMQVRFDNAGFDWPTIRVIDANTSPSGTESDIIKQQIVPHLVQFIKANRAQLSATAIRRIKARFAAQLAKARAQLDKLEEEAKNATY